MPHAQDHKDISQYNSFEVFDDIYGTKTKTNYNQLDMPDYHPDRRPFFYWFALFLLIIVLGFSIHPLLSYALKTPYPLVVIGEDSMQPSYKMSEIVVVSGLIDKSQIQPNDVIVFQPLNDQNFTIQRVIDIQDNQLTIKSDLPDSPTAEIHSSQVIGKVISERSIYLPLVDKISNLLARK